MTSAMLRADPVGARAAGWVSAHVFYRGDLDRLLVETVAPLVRDLAGESLIGGYFFIRYWEGGPHLRLRCRVTAGNHVPVEQRIIDRVGPFLARQPAATPVSDAEYRRYAATVARAEGVTEYLARPLPDNALAFIPYRPEHERYGYGASLAAVERHFQRSSEIVLGLLVAGLRAADRASAALAMTMLAWFAAGLDPDHAGRLAARLEHPAAAPDPELHERQREPLRRLAKKMRALSRRSGELTGAGSLLGWARSVRSLHDALASTLDRDEHRSPFTVLDTCAHLACNRLGLDVDQERHLRYLAARAVAELGRES